MDEEPREYYETRFGEQIKEFEAELDSLEVRIETTDWEPESDYIRVVDENDNDLPDKICRHSESSFLSRWTNRGGSRLA